MPLYDSLVGRGSRQNTEVQAFATAIRNLSTAHKRVTNMQEATQLKLKWAEENHNIALQNAAEKLQFERTKRERLEYDLEEQQRADEAKRELLEKQKEARGGILRAFTELRRKGPGEEGERRAGVEEALVNLVEQDPEFSKILDDVIGGAIAAVDAPERKEREQNMARLKELKADLELSSEKALAKQREASAKKSEAGVRVGKEEFEREAEEYRRQRLETARQDTVDGVYREMGQFGGREEIRKEFSNEYQTTVNNLQAQLNSLMRDIDTQLGSAVAANVETIIDESKNTGGGLSIGMLNEAVSGVEVDEATQTKINSIADITNSIVNARETYNTQSKFVDTVDTLTNEVFNSLVRSDDYTPTEAKQRLTTGMPEIFALMQKLQPEIQNLKERRKTNDIPSDEYMKVYEKYISENQLSSFHRRALKVAWSRFSFIDQNQFESTMRALTGNTGGTE